MSVPSPRKNFLELLAPRWRIPPCPFGNKHHAGLCMGTSVPENIGRCSFYCKPRAGAMVCPDEDRLSPILSDGERARLNKALQTFTRAISSGSNIEQATALGLAASEAEAHAQTLVAGNAEPPMEVDIFVYLEANDTFVKQRGTVKNGSYSLLLDSALCSLINFPTLSWSVYDRFRREFIPVPTFSALNIVKDEFLVIRVTDLADEDCKGLAGLLHKLDLHNLPKPEYPGQARKARKRVRDEGNAVQGPSKRRKVDLVEYIEIDSDSE